LSVVRVGIVGFGTIGRRVADAVLRQPDMKLMGVVKITPDYKAKLALEQGINLFVPEKSIDKWEELGLKISGTVKDLIDSSDIVIDATPGGVGSKNLELYKKAGRKAILQGGEKKDVVESTVVPQVNYYEARGKMVVRVPSCNTTGLVRCIWGLKREVGVERVFAFLARRAADPADKKGGPLDCMELNPVRPPSHHGEDVKTVLKDLSIFTAAVKTPVTHAHVHMLLIKLSKAIPREDVVDILAGERRVLLVPENLGMRRTSDVFELSRHLGRPFNNIYENIVWLDSIYCDGEWVYLAQAIHQEAIVVPENVDVIRAMCTDVDAESSMNTTDIRLGIRKGIL